MISDETIQTVRDRIQIADIVGERVKLKRAGRSLLGLCPFHKEKTPSFNVNEERNFYHCFGCGASGDAIKFVQETEGLSFIEAIRELAQTLNLEIVETRAASANDTRRNDAARRLRSDLLATNEAAAQYFEECLKEHPLCDIPQLELTRRGLGPEHQTEPVLDALASFRVGYAPYSWDRLAKHLSSAGLSLKAAETVGLVGARKSGDGFYDRFRHRLMFAIVDLRGQIVGFSGRALDEPSRERLREANVNSLGQSPQEQVAKYINSPESSIYKKREVVFGLHQARNAMRQEDQCILVEGNFDVISLHARGLLNVAAPLGTAFTQEQAAQLRRYSPNVTLLFDGDKAGRRANVAAREPCAAEAMAVKVASLPDGVDPDDLARTRGIETVRQCIKHARGMLEYLIETTLDSGFKAADPESQGRKVREVLELIASEEDPTTRALAQAQADTIAARLGITDVRSFQALRRAISQAIQPVSRAPRSAPPEHARSQLSRNAIASETLGSLVEYPDLLDENEVADLLVHVTSQLALDIAAIGRWRADLPANLQHLNEPLRRLAAGRLAAPELGSQDVARESLLSNLNKLKSEDERRAKADKVERLRKAVAEGDTLAEVELLAEQSRAALSRRR